MRVALFFDGNNFYRAFEAQASGRLIDYDSLSALCLRIIDSGSRLVGAHYYTGAVSYTHLTLPTKA